MYYVETPAISSIIDVMKTTVWGESGFPARFLVQGLETLENRNGPILVGENMAVDQDARDLKAEGIRDDYSSG